MNIKRYLIILALFFVLFAGIGAISAQSNDSMDNITSDADDTVLQNSDDNIALADQKSDVEALGNDENASNNGTETAGNSSAPTAVSSKSAVKITTYSNFVKKGSKYYMYLLDSNGNPVAKKKLTVKYNGKTYKRTTDKYGKFYIKIKLSKSSTTLKVKFKGDKDYNPVSKNLKVYIDKSITISIGNSKLLTNGYLRVYFDGPKKSISHKKIKIRIGGKTFTKKTTSEGFVVIKPEVGSNNYTVQVQYKKYKVSKKIECIEGNVSDPLKTSVPTRNGAPDIDVMPKKYVMAGNSITYTLKKTQYLEVIKRDSYTLFLHGKLSKYTFFKSKSAPNTCHIIKRQKWNVIERAILTKVVKKNKYKYWPGSITVSLKGKSYTYPEVRDIQNTEVTCGPTSSSMCTQVLKKYYSEKYFQIQMKCVRGVNIPVIKKVLEKNKFKAEYFNKNTLNSALNELKNGSAIIAFLHRHYVSIIDVSSDGKKVLVSNSYGAYNVGGDNRVPTGWVSLKYFKTKFGNTGLVVKLDYKLSQNTQNQINNFYSSMGTNWNRQNTKERIPNIGL